MIGEVVTHSRYGWGVVTAFDSRRIEIRFEAGEPRTFAYPEAVGRYLRFEREEADTRARADLAVAETSRQEKLRAEAEARRRREEQLSELRREAQRLKRSQAAKKAASSRAATQSRRAARG